MRTLGLLLLFITFGFGFGWLGGKLFDSLTGAANAYLTPAECYSRPHLRAMLRHTWQAAVAESDEQQKAEILARLSSVQKAFWAAPVSPIEKFIVSEEYFWPGLLGVALAGFLVARIKWPAWTDYGASREKLRATAQRERLRIEWRSPRRWEL